MNAARELVVKIEKNMTVSSKTCKPSYSRANTTKKH